MTEPNAGVGPAAGAVPPSAGLSAYRDARRELLSRPVASRPARRRALSALTDDWLADVFEASGAEALGACLVAVGG